MKLAYFINCFLLIYLACAQNVYGFSDKEVASCWNNEGQWSCSHIDEGEFHSRMTGQCGYHTYEEIAYNKRKECIDREKCFYKDPKTKKQCKKSCELIGDKHGDQMCIVTIKKYLK